MKITFLGTSHGMENPVRNRQAMLFEVNENAYLVDAGAPVLKLFSEKSFELSKLKAIFISHAHGDHTEGLADLLSDIKDMNIPVFLPDRATFDRIKEEYRGSALSFKRIEDGEIYNDGTLTLWARRTMHINDTEDAYRSYGFTLEGEGKRVVVTSDMSADLCDFPKEIYTKKADLVISECAHFTATELFERLRKSKIDRAAIIHVYPMEKYEELIPLKGKDSFELLLPEDNDIYIL